MRQKPELIFVCGCNGAGKSTLTRAAHCMEKGYALLDPDRISLEEHLTAVTAGREVSRRVREYIAQGTPFIKESTLTSKFDFSIAARAKDAGFTLTLIYIGLQSAALALARVRSRVRNGGHNVPAEDICRRYERSLANLVQATKVFDSVLVLDNSGPSYREVALFRGGCCARYTYSPSWFCKVAEKLRLESPSSPSLALKTCPLAQPNII